MIFFQHFVCAHCNLELGSQNFFERDGRSYCESDYHKLFSPRCAKCQEAILDKCVTALDQTYHPDCFKCEKCDSKFGDDGFHEKEGKAYCKNCFFSLFAPRCGGCEKPITENYISSLDKQWHPSCFVCSECGETFSGGELLHQVHDILMLNNKLQLSARGAATKVNIHVCPTGGWGFRVDGRGGLWGQKVIAKVTAPNNLQPPKCIKKTNFPKKNHKIG